MKRKKKTKLNLFKVDCNGGSEFLMGKKGYLFIWGQL